LSQNGAVQRRIENLFFHLVKKIKRTIPPVTVGRRKRFTSEMSQQKEREAINAALKRLVGEDGFRANGAFSKRLVTLNEV
jgi:hypothetical protein